MALPALLIPALQTLFVSVVLPLLVSLVAIVVDQLTGNLISGTILTLFLTPVIAIINTVVPEFDLQSLINSLPSELLGMMSFYGLSDAINFMMSSYVNIFSATVTAVMHMHFQSFLMRRATKRR